MTHSQITSFLWPVADLIRDTFKRGKYQDVILPLTVLRRIDQVLEPTKEKVLKTYREFKGKLDNPDDLLRKASGYAFYNTSLYTFERLVDDPQNIAHNLRTYIQSFSPNMREVIEKFDFDNTIAKLDDARLLFQVMEKFAQVDLHPDRVSNPMMGTIFEELIRKFNENPGEHFRPHDVVERSQEVPHTRYYTRIEILAACGVGEGAKMAAWQSGVWYVEELHADLLAFTLDKTGGAFSPTTCCGDFGFSRDLIRWERQSVTGADSETGRRYQQHARRGSHVLLARLNTGERAFHFLGPATYVPTSRSSRCRSRGTRSSGQQVCVA